MVIPEKSVNNWRAALVILVFALAWLAPLYSLKMQDISDNWVKYRCDPRVMPFASMFGHDTVANFADCAQQIQGEVIDEALAPLNYNLLNVGKTVGGLGDAIQDTRKVMNQTRGFLGEITSKIFSVFLNITLQFENMTIKTRDLVAKLLGVVATLLYMLTGGVKIGESIVDGPIVGMMKSVCFDPYTPVKLECGKIKSIQDIETGEVLAGGSYVVATMRLKNTQREPYYLISGVKVTGYHKVRNDRTGQYVFVHKHPDAKKLEDIPEDLNCLITHDHLIRLGETTFWDWTE
jgi:hypothetical protein